MSQVQVDNIYNLNADGPPTFPMGATVTGVTTSGSFSGDLTGNVTGNVNVGTSLTITASQAGSYYITFTHSESRKYFWQGFTFYVTGLTV